MGTELTIRVEWGFRAAPMRGFGAEAPAAPGDPVADGNDSYWFTQLDARGAKILAIYDADLPSWAERAGERTWKSRPAGGDTAAVTVACSVDPDCAEPLLSIGTDPAGEAGFCINLNTLASDSVFATPTAHRCDA